LHEALAEVDKSHEGLDFSHISQGWPIKNTSHLNGVHFYATFQEDEAERLYHGSSKHALLGLEVELILAEDVKDIYYNGMMLLLVWLLNMTMSFIIIWNISGLLVRPKNMNRG